MTKKISGSEAFIKKIEEMVEDDMNSAIDIRWVESSYPWIEITCKLNQVEILIDYLKNLEKIGTQLSGKSNRGQVWFLASEVYTIEAFGNDVETIVNKQRVLLDKKLYEYESELASEGFIRIGKSLLVNTNKIESVASAFNGKLMLYLVNDEKVYVNRSYSKHFKEALEKKRG